jgi:amidase
MTPSLEKLTATEIASGVRRGAFTAEAVARACLDRVALREPEVQAWASLDPDLVLRRARAIDASAEKGPLAGVPFGVKDIIDTEDLPTEWGTPIRRGMMAGRDAACVALSRRAGGLMFGKAVTTEFVNQTVGPTRNPVDTRRTPGGSSSGSAAAVADFHVPLALGTQTTGSTTRPASFCGIHGYRPTYGELRMHGVMEACGSLDTLGLLARSVEDVALWRDVLLGVPPEPVPAEVAPPRIGLWRGNVWSEVDPVIRAGIEAAAERLGRAGAIVGEVALPAEVEALSEAHGKISNFEYVRALAHEIATHWDGISEPLRRGKIAEGLAITERQYRAASDLAEDCRRRMVDAWAAHDLILAPGATSEAPLGWDALTGGNAYRMWTVLHVPSITLPLLAGPSGLPVGLQLVAARHRDRALFARAKWVERVLRP